MVSDVWLILFDSHCELDAVVHGILNIEMSFEGFIWPHFNQNSIMVKLRTNTQITCPVSKSLNYNNKFSNINYRWLRQCKQSSNSNDKILTCWFLSKTFRFSSDTKTSAISFRKIFGESIDFEYWEICLTSCDRLATEFIANFGFDIFKIQISQSLK